MCRLTRMVCQNGGKFERLEKILFNNIVFKAIFFRSRSHSNVHFQFQKKKNFFLRYGHFKSNLLLFA